MRNLIKANSQTSSLIDHKCRQSFIATDVFLSPTLLWMLIDAVVGFDQRTHTHTHTHTHALSLSVSLSLCFLALFPLLSVSHKNPLANYLIINWNTEFNVLACSHFKGSINTKIAQTVFRLLYSYQNFIQLGLNEADMNKSSSTLIY